MSTLDLIQDNIGGFVDRTYTVVQFKVENLNQNKFELEIFKFNNEELINFLYNHLKLYKDIDREEIIDEKERKMVSTLCDIINNIIHKKRLSIYSKGTDFVSLSGWDIFIFNEWEKIRINSSILSTKYQCSIESYFE